MRKKILSILLIAPMLLSGCTIIIGGGKINSGGSSGTTGSSGSGEGLRWTFEEITGNVNQ